MKLSKKIVSLILCAVLVAGTVAAGGSSLARVLNAVSVRASADENEAFTYTLSHGKATVTGYDGAVPANLVIPDTLDKYPVTAIGKEAFYNCADIVSVTIPDSVTEIGDSAFCRCTGLEAVLIPAGVKSIGDSAFAYCTGIESMTVSEDNTAYYSDGNCIIETAGAKIVAGCTGSVIPTDGSVTAIGANAFLGLSDIKSVVIPDCITSIGSAAFGGCDGLTSITVSEDNTVYHSDGNCIIETESKKLVAGCRKSVIPTDGSVTSIGDYAFYLCAGLAGIAIPDGITTIGNGAFSNCIGLTYLDIPASVTKIGSYAFAACSGLETIAVSEDNTVYHSEGDCLIETQSKTLVAGCKNSVIPDDGCVTSIGFAAFYNCPTEEIIIPEGITSIGGSAFFGCTGFVTASVPEGVTVIGDDAFSQCSSLEQVDLPESLETVGKSAFSSCTSLNSVVYGGNVEDWENIDIKENNECLTEANILFNKEPYKAIFMADGNVVGTVEYTRLTEEIEEPAVPGKTGHSGRWEEYELTVDGVIVNAIYTPNVYKVTYYANGEVYQEYNVVYGTAVKQPLTEPEKFGSVFTGWSPEVPGSMPATNLSLYAQWDNIYNVGEESYSFINYQDLHGFKFKSGHCFGMAVTSSAYYLGILDKTSIGGSSDSPLSSFGKSEAVTKPICHYLDVQGNVGPRGSRGAEIEAIVAGGSLDLTGNVATISDWNACVSYVSGHEYDYTGALNIGMWYRAGGGHAVNFIHYNKVNGQDRIYAYDNNYPGVEVYYYMGSDGFIHEKSDSIGVENVDIKGFDLMDVRTYFEYADSMNNLRHYIYADKNEVVVKDAEDICYLKGADGLSEFVVYTIAEELEEAEVKPLEDDASFRYMGVEYYFEEVDEETYGTIEILPETAQDGDEAEFKIYNPDIRVGVSNFVAERTEAYRSTINFTATTANAEDADDLTIHWFINGEDLGTGEKYTVEEATDSYTVQVKFINDSGDIIYASDTEKVTIRTGFIYRLIAFIRNLFGLLPVIDQ